VYRTVATEGPDHARTFVVEVRFGDRVLGHGTGSSKREAEQAAAALALTKVDTEPDPSLSSTEPGSPIAEPGSDGTEDGDR
jgi:ribonuclease-3